jgi:hypothetical protein
LTTRVVWGFTDNSGASTTATVPAAGAENITLHTEKVWCSHPRSCWSFVMKSPTSSLRDTL